jgi:exopolysaccharide biosynthesis WecB/TagA/CpsF family protein
MGNVLRVAHSLTGATVLPPRPVRASYRHLFGLELCDLAWDDALSHIQSVIGIPGKQTVLSFLNAHNANVMLADANYRHALSRHLVFPDGVGVNIASRLLNGRAFPANLNGTDFVPALLTYISEPMRVGLLGAAPDVLQGAAETFHAHTPWHTIIPVSDGYFDKDNCGELLARIEAERLDVLIVAMGTPLQEVWVDRHIRPEHASLVITAGALFDFVSGRVSRAPVSWRRLRLEWLHRLRLEPKRLWKRYILGIPLFFLHLMAFLLFDSREA